MAADHIDFDTCTIHGVLKQIRHDEQEIDEDNPPLVKCWVATIPTSKTKQVVAYLRNFSQDKFPSIKRFQKHLDDSNKLRAVICTTDERSKKELNDDILTLIGEGSPVIIDEFEIPSILPRSKEMAMKWSRKFWPMAWKGNPNHQFLKSLKFDISSEKQLISQLLDSYNNAPEIQHSPRSVTIMARELKNGKMEQIYVAHNDLRAHPLDHSVMRAIKKVAVGELKRRETGPSSKATNQYLCLNLVVYTTHEPCVMCCMALVHSRIDRIVYIKDSPDSGGLASHYQLGDRDGLNWKFQIWKWMGEELNFITPITRIQV